MQEVDGFKSPLSLHPWPDIGKLHYERKRFDMTLNGTNHKVSYYSQSSDQLKYLLAQCMQTHTFQRDLLPKIKGEGDAVFMMCCFL